MNNKLTIIKSKLIQLEIGKNVSEISKDFSASQYKRGLEYGFELIDLKPSHLHGKFIEEISTHENSLDPYGNLVTNKIKRFLIFEFTIMELKPHQFLLKIDSPPRSLKSFTKALLESLGFGLSLSNLNLDLLTLISDMKNLIQDKKWLLKKIRISNVRLSPTSISKIEIYSQTDAYDDANSALNLANTIIERVWFDIKSINGIANLEISSSGFLVGDENEIFELLPIIKSKIINRN